SYYIVGIMPLYRFVVVLCLFFSMFSIFFFFFFFFQAEDGIRDYKVTGVQTCALPISSFRRSRSPRRCFWLVDCRGSCGASASRRSEERRVGKECRSRWSPDH